MRVALAGQQPVKLYGLDQGGFWNTLFPQTPPAPAQDTPPAPMNAAPGAPPPMAQPVAPIPTPGSGPLVLAPAAATMNAPITAPRNDGFPRPPANVGSAPAPSQKNIFEKLFGG